MPVSLARCGTVPRKFYAGAQGNPAKIGVAMVCGTQNCLSLEFSSTCSHTATALYLKAECASALRNREADAVLVNEIEAHVVFHRLRLSQTFRMTKWPLAARGI